MMLLKRRKSCSEVWPAMTDTVKACPDCDDGGLQTFPSKDEYYCRVCRESFPMDEAVEREKQGHSMGGRRSGGVRALLEASPDDIGSGSA